MIILPISTAEAPLAGVRVPMTVTGTTATGTLTPPSQEWMVIAVALSVTAGTQVGFATVSVRELGGGRIGPVNGDFIGVDPSGNWSPMHYAPVQGGISYTVDLAQLSGTAFDVYFILRHHGALCP
jgi:hypothetical protein